MSTESETKSAGVPAGATHQCTKCGAYWLKLKGGTIARMSGACLHPSGDVRPIAEASPAPTTAQRVPSNGCTMGCDEPVVTTAAPAELPNRREFHVSTPAEFAAAAQVAQGGDAIIVPAEWPRESPAERPFRLPEPVLSREEGEAALRDLAVMRGDAPAEQLSGKVVCRRNPHFAHQKDSHYTTGDRLCVDPRPAEQLGKAADSRYSYLEGPGTLIAEQPRKAADPRPAQPQAPLLSREVELAKSIAARMPLNPQTMQATPDDWTVVLANALADYRRELGAAQPQAPAEPSKEQIEKAKSLLAWTWDESVLRQKIAAAFAAETAPLREERDRLAGQLAQAQNREDRHANEIRHEQERWIRAEAERDRLAAALNEIVTHHDPDKMRALAYAALGAPEGQPPAPSEAPLDALTAAREWLKWLPGKENEATTASLAQAFVAYAALSAPPPPPREARKLCAPCRAAQDGRTDSPNFGRPCRCPPDAPAASAPPRKAPQGDALAANAERVVAAGLMAPLFGWLYSSGDDLDLPGKKGECNDCGNEAVIDKQGRWICDHAPACSVAAAERYVQAARRASSPEEQLSEAATTKKEG